ncbi:MAG TPA: class I SAM-dependent methyltransferase [Actinomycetota bacterium]|nr:class I SAM-dependent methyltransferase [Actinomycetota bacterium]
MSGSIRFDRAVEFYDQTRAISEESMERTVELLASQLDGRGRLLEVGVGTGLLALPLHERGLDVTGLDLAEPMLAKLTEKAGRRTPFPLVLGDATRMPFRGGSFGGAYLRWVLHLIPDWRTAVAEIVRVVRPGGAFVASLGAHGGPREEISDRFAEETGLDLGLVGLDWGASDELDEVMRSLGCNPREIPQVREVVDQTLDSFIGSIAEGRWSWTWRMHEDLRRRTAERIRPWAEARFGPLDAPYQEELATRWCAYDLPERGA